MQERGCCHEWSHEHHVLEAALDADDWSMDSVQHVLTVEVVTFVRMLHHFDELPRDHLSWIWHVALVLPHVTLIGLNKPLGFTWQPSFAFERLRTHSGAYQARGSMQ